MAQIDYQNKHLLDSMKQKESQDELAAKAASEKLRQDAENQAKKEIKESYKNKLYVFQDVINEIKLLFFDLENAKNEAVKAENNLQVFFQVSQGKYPLALNENLMSKAKFNIFGFYFLLFLDAVLAYMAISNLFFGECVKYLDDAQLVKIVCLMISVLLSVGLSQLTRMAICANEKGLAYMAIVVIPAVYFINESRYGDAEHSFAFATGCSVISILVQLIMIRTFASQTKYLDAKKQNNSKKREETRRYLESREATEKVTALRRKFSELLNKGQKAAAELADAYRLFEERYSVERDGVRIVEELPRLTYSEEKVLCALFLGQNLFPRRQECYPIDDDLLSIVEKLNNEIGVKPDFKQFKHVYFDNQVMGGPMEKNTVGNSEAANNAPSDPVENDEVDTESKSAPVNEPQPQAQSAPEPVVSENDDYDDDDDPYELETE